MKWFRFYHEFVDDPKIAMMSDSDQLLWVKALCLASDSSERGKILLTDEEICWKLRITKETWLHAIDKFRAKGMIEHCERGYQITNWDKRQFLSDSSAERVAKHRQNSIDEAEQKDVRNAKRRQKYKEEKSTVSSPIKKPRSTVTTEIQGCNVTESLHVTSLKRPQIQIQITDPDPYSDPEIKKEEISSSSNNIGDSDESQRTHLNIKTSVLIDPIDAQETENHQSGHKTKQPDPEVATGQPQEELIQGALVTTKQATRRGKSSAAANNSLSRKKQPTEWDDFKDLYNTRKPLLWSAIEIMTKDRVKVLQNLINESGSRDKALEVLGNALNYACEDSWYCTKTLSFENLKSNGKIFQLHERWLARAGVPTVRMTEGNLALMGTYSNLMNILGGNSND